MLEEERRRRLNKIIKKKEDAKELRKLRAEMNRLKKLPDVKRYLELEKNLENEKILTNDEIKNQVMGQYLSYCSCCHDIWYYFGAYQVERGLGFENRDRYYQVSDSQEIDCYCYRCLDCFQEIKVSAKENEQFLKEHTVIKTRTSFDECRKIYCELLCTNSVSHTYKKLMRKI